MHSKQNNVVLELSVDNSGYQFATTIKDAQAEAETELVNIKESIKSIQALKPECDKLDYILASCSGALCGIIDIFLVGKPGESPVGNINDKWFESRVMSFAKMWHPQHKDFNNLKSSLEYLEGEFKVPYDQTTVGGAAKEVFNLSPANHHYKSLAHNPTLLGLFFSILDQFNNTAHFVTGGQLITLEDAKDGWELKGNNIPSKIFCGFVNWIGHLFSDVSGSSSSAAKGNRGMGIPSPFIAWINDIIVIRSKLGLSNTESVKSLNELAIKIFEKGYDVRFTTAQAIPVFLNEMLVRLMYSIRRMYKYFHETPKENRSFKLLWTKCEPFSNATVKRMLTVAHGTFCLIDVGDAVVRGFIAGAGTFNVQEFILRLNIVGVGRFTISLYGEAKRAITYQIKRNEAKYLDGKQRIVENYLEELKTLSFMYNDEELLTFVNDFEKSGAYTDSFNKSAKLAELRNVPKEKILKTKSDIDKYFRG